MNYILDLQSISRDVADNVSPPRRLDPTMELITYSFVLYCTSNMAAMTSNANDHYRVYQKRPDLNEQI